MRNGLADAVAGFVPLFAKDLDGAESAEEDDDESDEELDEAEDEGEHLAIVVCRAIAYG